MMKRALVALALLASLGLASAGRAAAPDATLRDMLGAASACSDVSLEDFASRTCDSSQSIAAQAVATCQDKWNAVAKQAVGVASGQASEKERSRSLKIYSAAMEDQYMRVAELKAIDMRKASGRCGFD